jgi:hypothetical protein
MKDKNTIYTAFNARWLRSEEVGRTYVPMPQYRKLIRHGSSILMGPRGCGKTTLLKMLTPAALSAWENERGGDKDSDEIPRPSFYAIYVPSDTRWSYELALNIGTEDIYGKTEGAQRALVASTALIEMTRAFEAIIGSDSSSVRVCEELIRRFRIPNASSSFSDVRLGLSEIQGDVRAALNGSGEPLPLVLKRLASSMIAHVLDGPSLAVSVFEEVVPKSLQPQSWALCYDELEIAPEWLQRELLGAVRSSDQRFILKLTWSPVLPGTLKGKAEHDNDYGIIRLWHSHVRDAEKFCDSLTRRFLESRIGDNAAPDSIFGSSLLASDDDGTGEGVEEEDRYSRGSQFYLAAKALAEVDVAFKKVLNERGIDPNDPYIETGKERDKFIRKIRPTVFFREAFWRPERLRSRKAPHLYWGKQVIYAMSDGNPRWLIGLLNDLVDRMNALSEDNRRMSERDQATVLSAASNRFDLLIRATVSRKEQPQTSEASRLHDLVEKLGEYFRSCLMEDVFPIDEAGSVLVEDDIPNEICELIEHALEIGALVFVGKTQDAVVQDIRGSRFRLTFMLAPAYRKLLRNGYEVGLRTALRVNDDKRQQKIAFERGKEQ